MLNLTPLEISTALLATGLTKHEELVGRVQGIDSDATHPTLELLHESERVLKQAQTSLQEELALMQLRADKDEADRRRLQTLDFNLNETREKLERCSRTLRQFTHMVHGGMN